MNTREGKVQLNNTVTPADLLQAVIARQTILPKLNVTNDRSVSRSNWIMVMHQEKGDKITSFAFQNARRTKLVTPPIQTLPVERASGFLSRSKHGSRAASVKSHLCHFKTWKERFKNPFQYVSVSAWGDPVMTSWGSFTKKLPVGLDVVFPNVTMH